ncbi:MAG: hypothetical protein WAP54_04310 [Bacteroidales bacterium]|jgi:hypothetical protein
MKKAKIYIIEAKVRYTKVKTKYRSSWIELEKKLARKIYDNFKPLGKIRFIKDEENEGVLTFWANIWNNDIDIDYGRYKLKVQITEGNDAYPDPSMTILSAELLSKEQTQVEVEEEVDFTAENLNDVEISSTPPEVFIDDNYDLPY